MVLNWRIVGIQQRSESDLSLSPFRPLFHWLGPSLSLVASHEGMGENEENFAYITGSGEKQVGPSVELMFVSWLMMLPYTNASILPNLISTASLILPHTRMRISLWECLHEFNQFIIINIVRNNVIKKYKVGKMLGGSSECGFDSNVRFLFCFRWVPNAKTPTASNSLLLGSR